jgi:DNA-binding LacI/PurR family transcriptional regulator
MTIKDIARRAGVSPITVSRAVNNRPDISARTRARIMAIVERSGWRPSMHARGLVRGRSYTLGFLTNHVSTSFTPQLLETLEAVAMEHRWWMLVMMSQGRADYALRAFDELVSRRVDGIVLGPVAIPAERIRAAKRAGVRVVATYLPQGPGVPLFGVDYGVVGRLAGEHLAGLGHRKCLYLHFAPEVERDLFSQQRWDGFRAGGGPGFSAEALSLEAGGAEGLKARLAKGDLTAVFCQNDRSLPTVYRVGWELGLSIPRDLSVIGSVDMEITEMLSPKATSIEVAKHDVARAAALAIIEAPAKGPLQGRMFSPSLVMRDSTARATS